MDNGQLLTMQCHRLLKMKSCCNFNDLLETMFFFLSKFIFYVCSNPLSLKYAPVQNTSHKCSSVSLNAKIRNSALTRIVDPRPSKYGFH